MEVKFQEHKFQWRIYSFALYFYLNNLLSLHVVSSALYGEHCLLSFFCPILFLSSRSDLLLNRQLGLMPWAQSVPDCSYPLSHTRAASLLDCFCGQDTTLNPIKLGQCVKLKCIRKQNVFTDNGFHKVFQRLASMSFTQSCVSHRWTWPRPFLWTTERFHIKSWYRWTCSPGESSKQMFFEHSTMFPVFCCLRLYLFEMCCRHEIQIKRVLTNIIKADEVNQ